MITFKRAVFSENLESKLLPIFLGLFMGTFWICFIIWNRLIRERLPREVTGELYSFQFWILLYLCLFFSFCVIYEINRLQKKYRGIENTNPFVVKLSNYLAKFFENHKTISNITDILRLYVLRSPLYLWRFLYYNLPHKYHFPVILKFAHYGTEACYRYFNVRSSRILTVILLLYIPRLLVSSIFFYEVVINRYLNYFYGFAVIILIPLIFMCLRRMLFDICYYEFAYIEEHWIECTVLEVDEDGFNVYNYRKKTAISAEKFAEKSLQFS